MLQEYFSTAVTVMPFLLQGFLETLKVSFFAIIAGSVLGFVIGVARSYRIRGVHQVLGLYIHLLRGTPFLVQLYLFYFVLPSSGVSWLTWDSVTAAFVSLSVYTSSYVAEIVMGAILAVPRGQTEGAMTLGLRPMQILRLVVLPQAMRLIVQPMSGVYVMLIKSTAILSVVGITELTRQGEVFMITYPSKSLFIYALIALIYFLYCYPLLRLANWVEKRVAGSLAATSLA
ncbi:amino acid ABC transporter permease [Bordetella petrii]|uniref:amino acid ABC transporter permease n=1 Tax=Bordetella petrii TaxID=94624 RepID=UPI002E798FA4|nr:amino acid ABC transporter permease [Bordetella petrii]